MQCLHVAVCLAQGNVVICLNVLYKTMAPSFVMQYTVQGKNILIG
jgi:hypothetical protein